MSSTWTYTTYPATHDLNSIVDVVAEISSTTSTRRAFNKLCIIGSTDVIPTVGIDTPLRIREYANLAAMAEDGFAITDPEYLAATAVFTLDTVSQGARQKVAPTSIYVGRQNLTSLATVALNAGGLGYDIGDILTLVQSGASGGTVQVKTIGTDGVITALETNIVSNGSDYSVATGVTTTVAPSGGTGATIDISAIGETMLQAFQACRDADSEWYVGICPAAVKADHIAISAYAQTTTPSTVYAFTTADADVPLGTVGNVFETLYGTLSVEPFSRTIGQYSSQSVYAICDIMGYAMGANTGKSGSMFTLKFKKEPSVTVEPSLTSTKITAIEQYGGNVYLNYGNYYTIFEQGTVVSASQFFDEVLGVDMLVNDIQIGVMDLLYGSNKIPQTEAGVTQIVNAINSACDLSVTRGFLAPGTWTGTDILNVSTGDTLPNGYLVQSETIASQSSADREARKAPNMYVCAKLAGAVHSVVIQVSVNR